MLDEEATQRTFDDVHRIWVEPELCRRRERGELPEGFRIRRCLVLMPKDAKAIVKFNEEIGWEGRVQLGAAGPVEKGDPVYLAQIAGVLTVKPPEVDGERVAFVYMFLTGRHWKIVFDATPNLPPGYEVEPHPPEEWALGKEIAESINQELAERTVAFHAAVEAETRKIGLWAAPALVPYPLAAISDKCQAGDLEAARSILVEHCSADFLEDRVAGWASDPVFQARGDLFQDALSAHRDGKYTLSVHALMPQIEGVITEWIHSEAADVPWRHESKVKKLRDTLLADGRLWGAGVGVARSVISFMTGGPMLKTFDDWHGATAGEFPNRHAVGHGKFESSYFTEEMSVKVFLLLDTLHHLFDTQVQ